MEVFTIIVLFMIVNGSTASHPVSYDLSSSSSLWMVQNANASIRVSATVPGGIYSDLRNAGVLKEDLFYRFNDENYRWVAKDNWTFSTSFNVDSTLLSKEQVVLEFQGLDTVSTVLLNSHQLGQTDNMFVLYQFDVKHLLQEKYNKLDVEFLSPVWAAQHAAAQASYEVPPTCVPSEYHGECHVNLLRKMQASFAWDWGPAFPSVGIWKEVTLRGYNRALARNIGLETRSDVSDWKVLITLYLDVKSEVTGVLSATLILNDTDKITSERLVTVSQENNSPMLVFSVPKNKVNVWWPNGEGRQPLYRLTVALHSDGDTTHKTINIGFRTIQLIQEEAVPSQADKGLTFYFRVNGAAIFAKGSNYIPLHILPELSAEPERLRRVLTSARDANMNMLRVWGGGLYESDLFYQLCDELGILVWQDMMFACSMYPATDVFLSSVAEEVKQQVQRLQHHASIAIWAGNNENEAALEDNWYGTQSNFSTFKSDYVKLYNNTIKSIIGSLDKTRAYVMSSPSNGRKSEEEGFVASNPYDNRYGDVHVYQYFTNLWNPILLPKTRFASEYGIMSLPSIQSLRNVSLPQDLSLDSDFMNRRLHHLMGYSQIIQEIKFNLNFSVNVDMETFIYLSQINQAMSMKIETEAYRRGRNTLDDIGQGLTMGALYWQLNDVWQAPSWSSIEYNGKWKMLHYYAVDFFSPILVSPSIDIGKHLQVFVISDYKMHTSLHLTIQLSVYNWQSLSHVYRQEFTCTMVGAGVEEVVSLNIPEYLAKIDGCTGSSPEKNCFLYFSLLTNNGTSTLGPDNFYFPAPLHSINGLKDAVVVMGEIKAFHNNHELMITVCTDSIALFVWLDTAETGHFSHNGFLLVSPEMKLVFRADQPINIDRFKETLSIRTLKV